MYPVVGDVGNGEACACVRQGTYRKSLYLLLNSVVNLNYSNKIKC